VKSYFLEGVASVGGAVEALKTVLPGQVSPWVLLSSEGDAIAYFDVVAREHGVIAPAVQADVSGRHWDHVERVLATLEAVRLQVGGTIRRDE
jgi:hypothetical protein